MDPAAPFPRLTGTAEVSVRPARPDDAPGIARVQAVTWRTAYRALLPPAVLDEWDDDAVAAAWRAAVVSPPTPGHHVLVALERDQVVGFAAYGPPDVGEGDHPSAAGPTSEVTTLLVEPRWGRRGHGSRLLAAVVDQAAAEGAARLHTWLAEGDQASASFFDSAGWAPDGWARSLDTGGAPLRELRWYTLLADEPDDGDGEGRT